MARIAGTVGTLVVLQGGQLDAGVDVEGLQLGVAQTGVAANHVELLVGELALFVEDGRVNLGLADVVEQASSSDNV